GEGEGVADVVGDLLDFGSLVVVREDHRVALVGQPPNAGRPLGIDLVKRLRRCSVSHISDPKSKTSGLQPLGENLWLAFEGPSRECGRGPTMGVCLPTASVMRPSGSCSRCGTSD